MHIGSKNPNYDYTIFNKYATIKLFKTTLENDLGIYIQNDLKWTNQVRYCTNGANQMLGMIENFRY